MRIFTRVGWSHQAQFQLSLAISSRAGHIVTRPKKQAQTGKGCGGLDHEWRIRNSIAHTNPREWGADDLLGIAHP